MKKNLLTLVLAIATSCMASIAATKYEINVAGVEVTSDNCSNITGGDIKSGYGVYSPATNTLTLYDIDIYRTGQDNYGIHNRKCDNLTIVFKGTGVVMCADNALKLERGTTLKADGGSYTWFYSSARIVANLKSYDYYFTGSGRLEFESDQSGYEAIKGDALSSTHVYFQGARVKARSAKRSALSSFVAYAQSGSITIEANGSNASVNDVFFSPSGRMAYLEPYGAHVASYSIYDASGSPITSETIYISDDYVAILNSTNFPDANFLSYLVGLYPKRYITSSEVDARTSLNVRGKSIANLKGIEFFSKLTWLDCSNNKLTSPPSLPSTLTYLDCSTNQLKSLGNLPGSIETLYCNNNEFSGSIYLDGFGALKTLDISNNKNLTKLECYNNALTSLNVMGCSTLQTLYCQNNQLAVLPWLPNSLQTLNCANNKFGGTLTVAGYTALKTLDVSYNTGVTTLNCYGNGLTTLNVAGCSALKTLDCANNNLASLTSLPSTLTTFNCSANNLTSLPALPSGLQSLLCASNKLTAISVQGLNSLEKLEIYNNQIKESAMGNLVNGMRTIPAGQTGDFKVQGGTDEGNVITLAQVKMARDKRWLPKKYVNGSWVEITSTLPGDVNGDGKVNVTDVTVLVNMMLRVVTMNQEVADVNGDGMVNASDVTALVNLIL